MTGKVGVLPLIEIEAEDVLVVTEVIDKGKKIRWVHLLIW